MLNSFPARKLMAEQVCVLPAAGLWRRHSLSVRLLTASPLKWLEIFTVASKRLKLLLTLSFGEYVGGYLNFFPEDSSSNTSAGMELVPF